MRKYGPFWKSTDKLRVDIKIKKLNDGLKQDKEYKIFEV